MLQPYLDEIITENEAESALNVDTLLLGCLNIYGVLPFKTFVKLIFDSFSGDEIKFGTLTRLVGESPILKMYSVEYKNSIYMVSPFVKDFEEILKLRREQFKDVRNYTAMDSGDAISAGCDSPHCAAGMDTSEGQDLRDMLMDLGYFDDELEEKCSDIWMYSQYALEEGATKELFGLINDKLDALDDFDRYSFCINTIAEYSNATPKWLLKGRTPRECNMMMISIKVDGPIDPVARDLVAEDPHLDLYNMGLAVRPVAADDPCPCGSGISYRRCHGRFRS